MQVTWLCHDDNSDGLMVSGIGGCKVYHMQLIAL